MRLPCRSPKRRRANASHSAEQPGELLHGPPTAARNGQSAGPQCSRSSGKKSRSPYARRQRRDVLVQNRAVAADQETSRALPSRPNRSRPCLRDRTPSSTYGLPSVRKPFDAPLLDRPSRSSRRSARRLARARRETPCSWRHSTHHVPQTLTSDTRPVERLAAHDLRRDRSRSAARTSAAGLPTSGDGT